MKNVFVLMLHLLVFQLYGQQKDSLIAATKPVSILQRKSAAYIFPAGLLGYGILSQEMKPLKMVDHNIRSDFQEDYPGFHTHLDDKLQYMPVASVYALGFAGIKGQHNFIDKTALYFLSNAIMGLSVDALKTASHRLRPDGSDYRAFPSGHTATAFAAAEFMWQEYKDVSLWYGVAGYTMATATGGLRMLNNKHWFSDVVTGAGIGIASTKLSYLLYPIIKKQLQGKKHEGLIVVPTYQYGSPGLAATIPLN